MTEYFSLKKALYKFIKDLGVTTYVYPGELPQNPNYPVTIFDIIDEVPIGRTHDIGKLPMREARVQLDIYAESMSEAEDAAEKYFHILGHFEGTFGVAGFTKVSCRWDNNNPDPSFKQEPTLSDIYGRSMDFIILY